MGSKFGYKVWIMTRETDEEEEEVGEAEEGFPAIARALAWISSWDTEEEGRAIDTLPARTHMDSTCGIMLLNKLYHSKKLC